MAVALIAGAVPLILLSLFPWNGGVITDKRAPGEPSHKTFQVQVEWDNPVRGLGPDWVTVTETEWDRCEYQERYSTCR